MPENTILTLLVYVILFIAVFYFFILRPNKKRQDEQRMMADNLQPGDRVMLSSGMFATIRETGETQVVVEIAPGVEATVLKLGIMKELAPADEEFEYLDDSDMPEADETTEANTLSSQDEPADVSADKE